MEIFNLVWNEEIIEHIARHDVSPEEVEEICFSNPAIVKSKQGTKGFNPTYYAMGQTENGRFLIVVFVYFKQGRAMVVSARDIMNQAERKYYERNFAK